MSVHCFDIFVICPTCQNNPYFRSFTNRNMCFATSLLKTIFGQYWTYTRLINGIDNDETESANISIMKNKNHRFLSKPANINQHFPYRSKFISICPHQQIHTPKPIDIDPSVLHLSIFYEDISLSRSSSQQAKRQPATNQQAVTSNNRQDRTITRQQSPTSSHKPTVKKRGPAAGGPRPLKKNINIYMYIYIYIYIYI